MIEIIEGVPGSGKSYYAVKERFLTWIRANRRIYVYVDGIYLDRLALFEGRELEELRQQITVWHSSEELCRELPKIEVGSAVLIDEAQTVFRAMQRVDPVLLRWLETHRHYGVDVVLMCQSYLQMSTGVTRLVEATTKFRKLSFVGLWTRTQAKVRGNPEDSEIIRTFLVTFEPQLYNYYASYAAAAVREERRGYSVWKSPKVLMGIAAGVFAIVIMSMRPWSSLGSGSSGSTSGDVKAERRGLGVSPPVGTTPDSSVGLPAEPRLPRRIVVQGVVVWSDGENEQVAKYVLANGQILTAAQIAGRYGVVVREEVLNGVPVLIGEGVDYERGGE